MRNHIKHSITCIFLFATLFSSVSEAKIIKHKPHQIIRRDNVGFFIDPKRKISDYQICGSKDEDTNKNCIHKTMNDNSKTLYIELRPNRPDFMKMNLWVILDKNDSDIINDIIITTKGFTKQQDVYNYLQMIYGEPDHYKLNEVQNGFGNTFKIIEANWTLVDGAEVGFSGAQDSLDEGLIHYSRSIK